MDYLKKLDEAIRDFQEESKHLKDINTMVHSMNVLLQAIQEEKKSLEGGILHLLEVSSTADDLQKINQNFDVKEKKLTELVMSFEQVTMKLKETFTKKLQDYVEHETAVHEDLLALLHKQISDDSESTKNDIQEKCVQFAKVIENIRATHDEFKANMDGILLDFKESEEMSRKELVETIHASVTADASNIIAELQIPIANNQAELTNSCEKLMELLEQQRQLQDILLEAIKTTLIKNNLTNNDLNKLLIKEAGNSVSTAKNDINDKIDQSNRRMLSALTSVETTLSKNNNDLNKSLIMEIGNSVNTAKNEINGKIDQSNSGILSVLEVNNKSNIDAIQEISKTLKSIISTHDENLTSQIQALYKEIQANHDAVLKKSQHIDAELVVLKNLKRLVIGVMVIGIINIVCTFVK